MPRGDYRRHELKKPKKGAKKPKSETLLTPPAQLEVIKKGKKVEESEEFEG